MSRFKLLFHISFIKPEPFGSDDSRLILDDDFKYPFPSPHEYYPGVQDLSCKGGVLAGNSLGNFFYLGSVFKSERQEIKEVFNTREAQFFKKNCFSWANAFNKLYGVVQGRCVFHGPNINVQVGLGQEVRLCVDRKIL